jgi:hypothetical protein
MLGLWCGGFAADEGAVGNGRQLDCLLEETIEQLAAGAARAPVEAEGELVEIVVEMLDAHGPLVSSQKPPLEE